MISEDPDPGSGPASETPVDDRLPHLRAAIDGENMARQFSELFARDYPYRGLAVEDCRVARVYHKPGKSARITYRVAGSDAIGARFVRWFWAELAADPEKIHSALKKAPDTWPGCGPWKPVTHLPSIDAVVHAFPHDPSLEHLGALCEPGVIESAVAARLPALGGATATRCNALRVEPVKYVPGQRCVMRYDVELGDAAGTALPLHFFGKTYKTSRSRYVFEALVHVTKHLGDDDPDLVVPTPIAHLDEHHTLWQQGWDGEALSAMAARLGWENVLATDVMSRIGRALARLHAVPLADSLMQGPAADECLDNAAGDAADIVGFEPGRRAVLVSILERLRASTLDAEAVTPCLIHGTFKIAQVLCRKEKLALVDFDSVAVGDPHYDLAEFIASVVYLKISDDVPTGMLADAADRFLEAYCAAVEHPCDPRRIAWYVVPFLLGKIHSSMKKREGTAIRNLPYALDVIEAWLDAAHSATQGETDPRADFVQAHERSA